MKTENRIKRARIENQKLLFNHFGLNSQRFRSNNQGLMKAFKKFLIIVRYGGYVIIIIGKEELKKEEDTALIYL